MSKVISFRLDPNNPREAQALEFLRNKPADGFSSRRILTDALIGMKTGVTQDTLFSLEDFHLAMEQVSKLLARLDGAHQVSQDHQPTSPELVVLHDHFLKSVKMAAKPGVNLD
jgi:hypothetical protein